MYYNYFKGLKNLYPPTKHDKKSPKYKGPSSIDARKQGFNARDMHPTQDTPRMGTVRVK